MHIDSHACEVPNRESIPPSKLMLMLAPKQSWLLLFLLACLPITAIADEAVSPLDSDGRVVQFERDIAPIFRERCLDCHGPDDAKNDFRIDDAESVMDYVEPEDVEGSSLFVDYMTSDDPDMLMPPPSHGGPMSAANWRSFAFGSRKVQAGPTALRWSSAKRRRSCRKPSSHRRSD